VVWAYLILLALNVTAFLYSFRKRLLLRCDCAFALILPTAAWLGTELGALPVFPPPAFVLLLSELGALLLLLRLVERHERWLPVLVSAFALIGATAGMLQFIDIGMGDWPRSVVALAAWAAATVLVASITVARALRLRPGRASLGIARPTPLS
jgi:hypothetical protein